MEDQQRVTVVSRPSFPMAFRYQRARAGWDGTERLLFLTARLEFDHDLWVRATEPLRNGQTLKLHVLPPTTCRLPILPLGDESRMPRDNYRDFLKNAAEEATSLVGSELLFNRLIFDIDRVAFILPDEGTAVHETIHRLCGRTPPPLYDRTLDPFGRSLDLAYSDEDGNWQQIVDAFHLTPLSPLRATVSSLQIETVTQNRRGVGYIWRVRNPITPSTDDKKADDLTSPSAEEDEQREITGETFRIYSPGDDFHLLPSVEEPDRVKNHAALQLLGQVADELSSEYRRIEERVIEDPGTAGDEGESNWQDILQRWLPPQFAIVTKGRVIAPDGRVSKQLDVLVLDPSYPKALQNKKLYFSDGVLAAFECKLTLRSRHLTKAFGTARDLRALVRPRTGTYDKQARSKLFFGLLGHSSEWSQPADVLLSRLGTALRGDLHPRDGIDCVCVADSDSFTYSVYRFPEDHMREARALYRVPQEGSVHSQYLHWSLKGDLMPARVVPLMVLLRTLWSHLAAEDDTHGELDSYFSHIRTPGLQAMRGVARSWPLDILLPEPE